MGFMREIKYKFWDKHNKVWVGPYTLKQLADEDQFSSDREWQPICSKWEWFECVEYVGRKDRKGDEVYEGDILGNEWGKYRIYWDTGSFIARSEDGFRFHLSDIELNALEVIGNVYEQHPELLEQA